jgi:hypothetical protein
MPQRLICGGAECPTQMITLHTSCMMQFICVHIFLTSCSQAHFREGFIIPTKRSWDFLEGG